MYKYLLLITLLYSTVCNAQSKVTGQIINASDKQPINGVSVFLNNATIGSTTGADGTFTLSSVKNGQYDLIVSSIGFESYQQTIMIKNADLALPVISLMLKTTMLSEVKIKPKINSQKFYEVFKDELLGQSDFASQCKILNPKAVYVDYDADTRKLIADSDDYIEIENKALGYKLRYLLKSFYKSYKTNVVFYSGSVRFEPLKGSVSDQRRWEKNRLAAYMGSSAHFLRALQKDLHQEEGFRVFRMIREPNKKRPTDSIIALKQKKFKGDINFYSHRPGDSLEYWNEKAASPKNIDSINKTPLNIKEFMGQTSKSGVYALFSKNSLYIHYSKKDDMDSIISFVEPYTFFDENGVVLNPASALNERYWASLRLANLLPVDYEPSVTKP